jgi:site-specific recombinase XerD
MNNPFLIHTTNGSYPSSPSVIKIADLLYQTKGNKNRTVPISQELNDERPKNRGKLFTPCRKAFERAVMWASIDLPAGQCTNVLHHTFASHFMMNGGNILILRDILGHSDIKMTMVYSHFSPDHLEDAVYKNLLNFL